MIANRKITLVIACCLFTMAATAAHSVTPCSEAADPQDAGVSILRCGDDILAAEVSAVHSPASSMSTHNGKIQLDSGAIAISSNSPTGQFTVLTPDAVVSGVGSEWIIAAEPGRTRTFVWRGTAVSRLRTDGSQKVLKSGDTAQDEVDPSRRERLAAALKRAKAH